MLAAVMLWVACAPGESVDLVIRNARITDARDDTAGTPVDIAIRSGRIESIRPATPTSWAGSPSIDVSGHYVAPGFVDLHVHLPPDSAVQDAILDRLLEVAQYDHFGCDRRVCRWHRDYQALSPTVLSLPIRRDGG